MNTVKNIVNKLPLIIGGLLLSLLLLSCSGDDEPKVKPYDHAHDGNTDMGKHRFEHAFAEQCVARETANSVNKDVDRDRFAEPCLCIATFLLKDLTATDAEKFINERKQTQSLRIKYDNAAYHCLQKKQPPRAPKIFQSR